MPNIGQQHSVEKSRQLQRNLYLAAKKDKQRRLHALYDRIFRLDTPLGISIIRDRIVQQQACKIVIEPIFEANFLDDSYG